MKQLTIILTLLILISAQLFAQWQPEVQLNDNSGLSQITNNKSIAVSGNVVHVVWFDKHDGEYQIYYKRSINKGASWQAAKRITNTTNMEFDPVVSVSGEIVNIFWTGDNDMKHTRSVNAGISWSPNKKITDNTYNSPSVAVSGSVIHLVWSGKVGEVFYKRSTNGGSTWGPNIVLSDRNSSSKPSIAVSNNAVHVVWQENPNGENRSLIYYKHSIDAGKTWKADQKFSSTYFSQTPSVAVSGGEVYIIWEAKINSSSNSMIYITRSPDGGTNWREAKNLTDNISDFASLSVSAQYVHFVWRLSSQLNYKRSINGGTTWEASTIIPISAGTPDKKSIVAIGQTIHMIWDNGQNVFYKRLLKESAKKDLNPKGQNTTTPAEEKTDEQKDEKGDEPKIPEEKRGDEKKDSEKWVITPSGAKGATGTVSITLPEGLEWRLDIYSSDDRALGTWDYKWNNKKTINLIPGKYNILFTYIPLRGVPIQKGMNTRLKAGILNVVTAGQWVIWNEEKTKAHVVYYKPSKIGLPVGKYNLQYNEQYIAIEIKEGETVEF